ncbi:AlpA family phage regulatory protein [Gammaproteobacteria bacterium]|jgi:prophage regulatory protein|nr:AlpA family phage regulatory protein [Gammaproteobacteria bacterium]MDB9789638.1 AlpA family phage regulatory protein [Gammaproteobacteria bacterium]
MKLLRVNQVTELTGLSSSSIYKQMREGNFPKSILITKRATAWPEEVIFDWISKKIGTREENRGAADELTL